MNRGKLEARSWTRFVLLLVGLSHLVVGLLLVFFPRYTLGFFNNETVGIAGLLWQCLGICGLVLGTGCVVARRNPYRHPLFLASVALALIAIALACLAGLMGNSLPISLVWAGSIWCLVWFVPLVLIAWGSIRYSHAYGSAFLEPEADDPLGELRTNTGKLLDELADAQPQMVVFLRHAGCTFCRLALADIQACRQEIERVGCGIVLVHLGQEDDRESLEVFDRYGAGDLPRISDPTSRLYRQFGLDLGGFSQLFGLRVWLRGFLFGVVHGHGIGAVRGNSFQMPGVYLYHCGTILGGFRHEHASDRPNYLDLARQVQTGAADVLEPATA